MTAVSLTLPMRRALANLIAGRHASFGLHGQSEHGGLTRTLHALRQRGLVTDDQAITQAGRDAYEKAMATG